MTRLGILIATSLIVTNAGCSKDGLTMAQVQGKVTLNGKLFSNPGTIHFVPQVGPGASAQIQPDGSYVLFTYEQGDGVVVGEHNVFFSVAQAPLDSRPQIYNRETGFVRDRSTLWQSTPPADDHEFLPIRYRALETTSLTASVEEGANTFDFDIEDD